MDQDDDRQELRWDCVTDRADWDDDIVAARDRLADAARDARWADVFSLLDGGEFPRDIVTVNSARAGGSSGYAPLHQAAWHGADASVVDELLRRGAWRTLRSTAGETPEQIARRRGHVRLAESVAPGSSHPAAARRLRRAQLGEAIWPTTSPRSHPKLRGHTARRAVAAVAGRRCKLLADAVDTYEESTVARRWEWQQASEGRRLTWFTDRRDLRKLADLGVETTDEDIAAENLDVDPHLGLSADAWDCIDCARLGADLLGMADDGGLGAVRLWLEIRDLDWVEGGLPRHRDGRGTVGP